MRHAADLRPRAVFVVCVAAAVALSLGGTTRATTGVATRPVGVAWGDRHFTSEQALGAWLGARGTTYAAWARLHPSGAYLMTHTARPRPKPATPERPVAAAYSAPASYGSPGSGRTLSVVLFLVVLLVAVALLPLRSLNFVSGTIAAAVVARALEIRFTAAACAAALLLGLLATRVLG